MSPGLWEASCLTQTGGTDSGSSGPPSEAPRDELELALAASLDAPGEARAALTGWLEGRVGTGLLDDVRLVVTELVANSLRHAGVRAGDIVRVRAVLARDRVRLEIEDPRRHGRVTRRQPGIEGDGGYGLHIVEALALRWGVRPDGPTCVWAELGFRR